jgi:hypothetical protein
MFSQSLAHSSWDTVVLYRGTFKLHGDLLVHAFSFMRPHILVAWGLTAHVYSFVKLYIYHGWPWDVHILVELLFRTGESK